MYDGLVMLDGDEVSDSLRVQFETDEMWTARKRFLQHNWHRYQPMLVLVKRYGLPTAKNAHRFAFTRVAESKCTANPIIFRLFVSDHVWKWK